MSSKTNIVCLHRIYQKPLKLYDKIVNQIRKDIIDGKYKPGEKIPAEPELMKLYNVGRSTIREAIKTLAISGILKVQQGSGTFVNNSFQSVSIEQRLRRADFDDINAARSLLEKEIVKLATEKHTEANILEMERNLEWRKQAIKAENPEECAEADIAFHVAIADACANPVLSDLYQSFASIMRNFFSARDTHGISHFAMNHHLHEDLLKAIKSRKPTLSQKAFQKILDNNY
jgi:DNA-binding FadR family transcriptional regulator